MSFSSAEAGAGSQWLCLYYIIHARKCWGGRGDQSLWGLCVCTEEQYVVIKQSWKGIRNPCASVYSRHFLLITLRSLLQPACVTGFIFSIDTATSQWVLHIVLSLNLFEKKYSWCFSTLQIICIWSHSNIIYTIMHIKWTLTPAMLLLWQGLEKTNNLSPSAERKWVRRLGYWGTTQETPRLKPAMN